MDSAGDAPSRVVFVAVKSGGPRDGEGGGRPRTRRKRALGLSDDATFEDFLALVEQRLALRGVKGIYHAATGAPLLSVDELQDVEDLVVEESDEPPAAAGPEGAVSSAGAVAAAGYGAPGELTGIATRKISTAARDPGAGGAVDGAAAVAVNMGGVIDNDDDAHKYVRRAPLHVQALRAIAPSLGSQALPTFLQWDGGDGGAAAAAAEKKGGAGAPGTPAKRRARARAARMDPRKILLGFSLLSCLATIVLLYSRLTPIDAEANFP